MLENDGFSCGTLGILKWKDSTEKQLLAEFWRQIPWVGITSYAALGKMWGFFFLCLTFPWCKLCILLWFFFSKHSTMWVSWICSWVEVLPGGYIQRTTGKGIWILLGDWLNWWTILFREENKSRRVLIQRKENILM